MCIRDRDWTYHFPHRHADELRHQLVLNMTRSDVQSYILDLSLIHIEMCIRDRYIPQ